VIALFYRYKEFIPQIDETAFIAEGAKIIGNVKIGAETSIWFNVVLRGDEDMIRIGNRCSIQENTVAHLYEGHPLIVEDEVTVGHGAIIHGCTLKKGALIGMGATVLDGAIIGENSIVGANALIPAGKEIPPNSLVLGSPGKIIRNITERDKKMLELGIETYTRNAREYQDPKIFEKISIKQILKT
jgi:carbonic anhydrase/acetyltransferase-like protein (isoleucine patch superfamily)